jgi:hypothetical protein
LLHGVFLAQKEKSRALALNDSGLVCRCLDLADFASRADLIAAATAGVASVGVKGT